MKVNQMTKKRKGKRVKQCGWLQLVEFTDGGPETSCHFHLITKTGVAICIPETKFQVFNTGVMETHQSKN